MLKRQRLSRLELKVYTREVAAFQKWLTSLSDEQGWLILEEHCRRLALEGLLPLPGAFLEITEEERAAYLEQLAQLQTSPQREACYRTMRDIWLEALEAEGQN